MQLDLTNTYYLTLAAKGCKRHNIRVSDSEQAVAVFSDFRDHNNLGGSQMGVGCGEVKDSNGNLIATVCYNGRVRLPNGSFLDGMSGAEWLRHVAA